MFIAGLSVIVAVTAGLEKNMVHGIHGASTEKLLLSFVFVTDGEAKRGEEK